MGSGERHDIPRIRLSISAWNRSFALRGETSHREVCKHYVGATVFVLPALLRPMATATFCERAEGSDGGRVPVVTTRLAGIEE